MVSGNVNLNLGDCLVRVQHIAAIRSATVAKRGMRKEG